MDTFEAIRTLLAIRQYQSKPIPAATLRRVVEAGRLTGSAKNLQPWHFVVVEDRVTLQKLGALARTGAHVAQAAAAVVVAVDKTPFAVSDASRAIQSMLLAAWADGVGSNWVGFGGLEEVKTLLGIPAKLSDYRGSRALSKADIPRLVEIATVDICHQTNPRKCTAADFEQLFATAL